MTISLVVAVGANGVIGADGGLPWRLPEDLRHFKELTMGHTLLMGRKTYESIGRPLPGRDTIVITRQPDWAADGVQVCHSLESAIATAQGEVYVVGGAEIYRLALPVADRLFLTEVDQSPEGDVCFPAWDRSQWRQRARTEHPGFAFVTYERAGRDRRHDV